MMGDTKDRTSIYINNYKFTVKADISILEATSFVGYNVSRFCYHETLSVVGTCRICLVEIEKSLRPAASCALPIINSMRVHIDTPLVKKARESVLEALLLNHPLDCPICDQAGECDLQDFTKILGSLHSRVSFRKRVVEDKECGALIKTIMTRCIHCTRCVRFITEVAGANSLGTFSRGSTTEIGGYTSLVFNSELSGNIIDLCPVGALTSKPYAFKSRPWGIKIHEGIDLTDSTGSNLYVHLKECEIIRILPKNNHEINGSIISDRARFSYDANRNQRLQNLFRNNFQGVILKDFREMSWEHFFTEVDIILKLRNRKVLFVVNDELDLESLQTAKKLANHSKSRIKVRSLNSHDLENSFSDDYVASKIEDVKVQSRFCFLLSSNLRLESSILNSKVRAKYLAQNFSVFSLGLSFVPNLLVEFVNLSVFKTLKVFEGKASYLSRLFIAESSPLLFIGDSLKKRVSNSFRLISLLRRVMPSAIVFVVGLCCNSYASSLMNVKSLSRRHIVKTEVLFMVSLDDVALVRYFFYLKKRATSFWFNTHSSQVAFKNNFIVPVTSLLETEGTFLNLEGRPQKTFKTSAKINQRLGVRNTNLIFRAIKIDYVQSKFLNYINEIVKMPKCFSSIENIFSTIESKNFYLTDLTSKVSLYPIKSSIEDFYTKGLFCKKSLTMLKCSQNDRKQITNFRNA